MNQVGAKRWSSSTWVVTPDLKRAMIPFTKTNLLITLCCALANWVLLIGSLVLASRLSGWATLFYCVIWVAVSRSLRAFENLTHEASHVNWCRRNVKLNDFLANWICAHWVGLTVSTFRETHKRHHGKFGQDELDPCRGRFRELGLDALDRRMGIRFGVALLRELSSYVRDYWAAYGGKSKNQGLIAGALHCVAILVCDALAGPKFAFEWLLCVVLPFVVFLPCLRLWAESSKHRYDGKPELEATFNNIGFVDRWLIHPASDGWHLWHHFIPSIPHHQLARADKFLRSQGLGPVNQVRLGMFEEPDRKYSR